jgi:probable addiction module antidote protein
MEIMMAEKYSLFDPAELLDSAEAIEIFMTDAFETGDVEYIAMALGIAARSKGMESMAAKSGLSRDHLNEALSANSAPTLKSILAVMKTMGLALAVTPTAASS